MEEYDKEKVAWQLESTNDQIVAGAQTLYINLLNLQQQKTEVLRSKTQLERQIKSLETMYANGFVSQLQLETAKSGLNDLESGINTLNYNIRLLKTNLNFLLGWDLDKNYNIDAVPELAETALAAVNLESDWATAQENCYALYAAQKTLDDTLDDIKDAYYDWKDRNHAKLNAQYTYQNSVLTIEMNFKNLYRELAEQYRLYGVAQSDYALEEKNFAADKVKYEQQKLSENDWETAQEDMESAQTSLEQARISLFTSYTKYRWAVDFGIIG
jgi:outer membrane protein TolC